MHYLHKILVYIPDALADADNCDLDETISAVRAYADSETEPYYGQAFDWRETETAGRWRNVYPENVLLAADDVDYFVEELENAKRNQCNEIDCCLAELKRTVGINLEEIINGILIRGSYEEELNGFNFMTPYYFISQVEEWDDVGDLSKDQYQKLINDPSIPDRIEKQLGRNDCYWEAFWESVSEVAHDMVAKAHREVGK